MFYCQHVGGGVLGVCAESVVVCGGELLRRGGGGGGGGGGIILTCPLCKLNVVIKNFVWYLFFVNMRCVNN